MTQTFFLVFFFVVLPVAGVLAGLRLARPAVLSARRALALAFLPVAGVGLTQLFC